MMKKTVVHVVLMLMVCSLVLVLPAASGENGKIAITSPRNDNNEIYVMYPDGSGQTQLTNNLMAGPSLNAENEPYIFQWSVPPLVRIYTPQNVATDGSGNIYITDSSNNSVGKYTSDGSLLKTWGSQGSVNGLFKSPTGIAVDGSGNVYVADTYNHRIQKFTSDGSYLAQWGSFGTGISQFNLPRGIAVNSSGAVYVADSDNNRIQIFNSTGGYLGQWGSHGTGNSQFNHPYDIAVNSSGAVYVVDSLNHRIQVFSMDGSYLAQWGSYGNGNGKLYTPYGIAVDGTGNVYVADEYNHRIQKFTSNGGYVAQWGSRGFGNSQFNFPSGIAIDGSGNVYVADTWNQRVQKFTLGGWYLAQWDWGGSADGLFKSPTGITVDGSGNVYVADTYNHRIQKFTSDGSYQAQWGSFGPGNSQFYQPMGIAVNSSGYIYIVDSGNNRIQIFGSNREYLGLWGSLGNGNGQFNNPCGIAVDGSGNVYVADTYNNRIQKFTSNGGYLTQWGSFGPGNSQFYLPFGIAVDGSGNVYVADTWNNRIQKFYSNGGYLGQWEGDGTSRINHPSGLAVTSSGAVYVSDSGNHRIQVFTSDGTYMNQWGSLPNSLGIMANGKFYRPFGIVMDRTGNAYIADASLNRIQKFSPSAAPVQPPVASFTVDSNAGTVPLAVKFTDTSTNTPTSWNWSFGDGIWFNTTVASQRNTTHTYTNPNTYIARLTVANEGGADTTNPGTTITVTAPLLTVSASPTTITAGTQTNVNFTVKNASSAVSGATVSLTGAALGSGTTGADGNATISVNAESAGLITTTAAKVGYTSGTTIVNANALPAPLMVTAPNGGETWQRGTFQTVTWSYTGSPGSYVKLVLLKAGTEVGTIASSVPIGSSGTGSYTWPMNPSGTTGSVYSVSVQSISQPTIKDTSNNYFIITPAGTTTSSITITSPTCGETWKPGTSHTVTWSYTGSPGATVKVVLLKGGVEVGTATSSTSTGSGGTGSYPWTISSGRAPGSDYQILVQSTNQPTLKGTSCYFTIGSSPTPTPLITVTAPNEGEIWKRGTTQTVTWSYTGSPGSYVKVVLLKGGVEVGTATYSTSIGSGGTGSYSWTISSGRTPGTNYRIRVTSVSQPSLSDTSNGDFTITLLSPIF